MLVLAAIAWADAPPALAIAVMVLSSAASAPYRPAAIAATPWLVAEDDLAAANAAESVVSQLGYFIGPALGAALISVTSTGAAFALNGVTFLLSGLLLLRVGDIGGGRLAVVADVSRSRKFGPGRRCGTLGRLRRRQSRSCGGNRAWACSSGSSRSRCSSSASRTSSTCSWPKTASISIRPVSDGSMPPPRSGACSIAPFTARLAATRSPAAVLVASGVLSGIPVGLLAVTRSPALAAVFLAFEGMGIIVFEVVSLTMLQRACSERVLGRVYGLVDASGATGQLVGSLSAPVLVGALSLEAGLWIIGLTMAGVSLAALPSMQIMANRTAAARTQLEPLVDRLRGIDVFAEVSRAGLERIARQTRTMHLAPGATLLAEGDPSDDVYVVTTGELVVRTARDGEVNRMGPDDVIGEIGLVRGIPRTATVEAVTETELLVLAGCDFLDAVTGSGPLPDPLRRTISLRLGRTHPWLEADRA